MPRKILVTDEQGTAHDFVETLAENEDELQRVLQLNPQLIPAEDLGLSGELLVVGRETQVASGAVDLLCLSSSGELVIVEFKTGPQNPDFRHALAQAIDYGSDLWKLTDWTAFDQGVVHRYLRSRRVEDRYRGCADLRAAAMLAWDLDEEAWASLTQRLDQVISAGDFHFVVAAQRFIDPMKATVSYLNDVSRFGRYFLVEVIRLEGADRRAYAAQVVHRPEARRSGPRGLAARASEAEFLSRITDDEHREAMSELLDSAAALGLTVAWGSKGASLRLESPDRAEPISIGWVFVDDDFWTSARHVTLGVDPKTLENHPSLQASVQAYCHDVATIAGSSPAGGRLQASVFAPAVFAGVRDQLTSALSDLVASAARG